MTDHDSLIASLEARLEAARQAKLEAITPFNVSIPLRAYRKDVADALVQVNRHRMAAADQFQNEALTDMTVDLTVDPTSGTYTVRSVTIGDQTLTSDAEGDDTFPDPTKPSF